MARAWDTIAEFSGPNELYELRLPFTASTIPAAELVAMLSELAGVAAEHLVLTREGRVLGPDAQLVLNDLDAPLVASEVARVE